ncbi:sex peptide receptor-related protein 2-like [Planococcus citri]|uniref:sex peptide receptor-related protein 2-like n=1 Tax=Planococcus citri TaxID=170843 RepID=UPI0031F80E21
MNPEEAPWTKEYHSYYNMRICGYMDMVCCVVTTISNTLIIIVFKRNTTASPINTIFIHIAITETLAILSFLPRSYHEYYRVDRCSIQIHRTREWEEISFHSYIVAFAFRHTVVWLTVMLGVWRYIAVVHPLKRRHWIEMRVTQKFIIGAYIFGFIVTIPPYICLAVQPSNVLIDEEGCYVASNSTIDHKINDTTIYEFKIPLENYPTLYTCFTIGYGILIKSLPGIVLTVISYRLIVTLIRARKRRALMVVSANRTVVEKQTDRTTIILILILALFIASEITHGISVTITGIVGPGFFWRHYYYIMEIANTFAHISESLNFVFYYGMSNQFRKNFKALFKRNDNRSSHDGQHINPVAKTGITETECLETLT